MAGSPSSSSPPKSAEYGSNESRACKADPPPLCDLVPRHLLDVECVLVKIAGCLNLEIGRVDFVVDDLIEPVELGGAACFTVLHRRDLALSGTLGYAAH